MSPAASTGQPALCRCSATLFPKGKGQAPRCGLMPAHPPSKRARDPLPLLLIGSHIQRRPRPFGPSCPNTTGCGTEFPQPERAAISWMVRLEAARSSPEGARAPAPHHRLIYSLQQAGHVLKIHIALHFTT